MSGVYIYMVQPNAAERSRRGDWERKPAMFPIIADAPIILGTLMFHDTSRAPDDPIYKLETIGM